MDASSAHALVPDPLAALGIDRGAMIERFGNDPGLISEVCAIFTSDCPRMIEQLSAAIASGDPTTLAEAVHAIKGAASNLTDGPIVERALEVDQLLRADAAAAAGAAAEELLVELEAFRAALVASMTLVAKHDQRLRVLIADDDPTSRYLLRTALSRTRDCLVFEATNGASALETIEAQDVALVFLDVHMPLMSGIAALRALRSSALHGALPAIMLTSEHDDEIVRDVMKLGIADYLVKPLSLERVGSRLARTLARLALL